jgi:hypothetical protein
MSLKSDYKPFHLGNEESKDVKASSVGRNCCRAFADKLEEMFIQHIPYPDFREYPPRFMFLAGGVLFVTLGMSFGALFGYLYATNVSNVYLAPASSGSSTSTCSRIESTNTGVFLGTQGGLWEGQVGFQYAEAAFVVTASNWKVSTSYYSFIMNELNNYIAPLANTSSNLDLGQNLLIWFSFSATPDPNNLVNRFNLIGDPAIALNRQYVFASISSVAGECQLVNQNAGFDKASGLLLFNIPYDEYISNPICMSAGNPLFLGYNKFSTSNSFQFRLDVYSLITALSVNLEVIPLETLVEITAFRQNLTSGLHPIQVSSYFNPKFPGMTPITCIIGVMCFVRIGPSTFALPFFHHAGNSTSHPEKCSCSRMTHAEKDDPASSCNIFMFLTGVVYFPSIQPEALIQFISLPAKLVHRSVFQPSFVSSAFGQNSPLYPQFNEASNRENMYHFCKMSKGNCSIITFSVFDVDNPDWSISKFYYQLQRGACQNRISVQRENW